MIDFFGVETYNTLTDKIIPFYKKNDIIGKYHVPFGNMNNGYPITIGGVEFANVEVAYICAFFSKEDEKSVFIQNLIKNETNGMMCKRKYRKSSEFKIFGREDFDDSLWHFHFMLFLVWSKCLQNKEFAVLLKKIPQNYIIVENEPMKGDYAIWGCCNKEYNKICKDNSKKIKEINPQLKTSAIKELENEFRTNNYNIGIWKGRNCMGKILMSCRDALQNNTIPPIDYNLLTKSNIYWFGKQLFF